MKISATRYRLPAGTATRGPRDNMWEDQCSLCQLPVKSEQWKVKSGKFKVRGGK